MRLILKDYIETLKEEIELETLLENILIMNDFKDIVRPQKGVAQHGVDFSAKKNGIIYLFVLKQKDIDKNNWNTGNNAVRPTLDEIQDVYIQDRIKDPNSKINIVVCTNGIIKQNVQADWNGYINRNSTDNTKYLFWGIDELTSMTEQVLLNEYLFEDDIKIDLRRSLYFYEEDVNFVYYKKLLEKLILKINISNRRKKIYKKYLIVYLLINKMCIAYASEKNVKLAEKMSEKALIVFWNFIIKNNVYEKIEEIDTLIMLYKQYEDCCENYLEEIKKVYNYSPSFPIYSPLEYRITIYEVIGFISSYTYYLYYYYGNINQVIENVNILITIINNNAAFFYPVFDLNSIEINTLIFLLKEIGNNQAEALVNVLINKMIYRMNISKYYPVEYENYDKALQIEFNEEVDEFNASVMITNLLEWMYVFKNQEGIDDVVEYLKKKFPNLTLNTLQIDLKSENYYFEGNIYDSIISYVLDYGEKIMDVNTAIKKIHYNNKIDEYNFYKYGSLPILFITARNYRIPLPSNIIYKFLEENDKE